jgi:cell volume regulation protein A
VEHALVLVFVGLLVFLAHLFVALFERTRVPDVLYLILIGVIVGPVLGIVGPEDFGKVGGVFTTIALVVILFEAGLELSVESLRSSYRTTLIITVASFVTMFVTTSALVHWVAAVPLSSALFVGAVLATPAPAVVIPLIRQLGLDQSTRTTLTLESPLGEALGIIVALTVLSSIRATQVQVGHMIGQLLSSFLFAILIGGVGGFFWSMLLHKVRQLRHAIFTTPSFIIILFGITEFLGYSGAMAALTFGVTLGNVGTLDFPWLSKRFKFTPLVHNEIEKSFFGEIVFLIKTFFFVYLGLSVRFTDYSVLGIALLLSAALLVARALSSRISTSKSTTAARDASVIAVMIPRGTAAAVLASIPLQLGMEGGNLIQNLVYTVVVISIVLTALLLLLLERGYGRALERLAFPGYLSRDQMIAGEAVRPNPGGEESAT